MAVWVAAFLAGLGGWGRVVVVGGALGGADWGWGGGEEEVE